MAAERAHGTPARYIMDRCHCDACRAANTANQARYRRRKVQERWGMVPPHFVDAGEAREHVRALMAAGMGWLRIAQHAGVSEGAVSRLLYGQPYKGTPPSARITLVNHRKLLAVQLDIAGGRHVDATGTRRRLQALMTVGRTGAELMVAIGDVRTRFAALLAQEVVTAQKARTVRDLYERWWNVTPPTDTREQRINVSKARNFAARHGFAPPMAWDDDTIDDPSAEPDFGARDPRTGVDLAEVAHLRAGGCSDEEIARRLGVTVSGLSQAEWRARRTGVA
jgi:transcriptional regulator with XRE-family HTH domain